MVRTFANKLMFEVRNLPQIPASVDWGTQLADNTVCAVTTKVFMYVWLCVLDVQGSCSLHPHCMCHIRRCGSIMLRWWGFALHLTSGCGVLNSLSRYLCWSIFRFRYVYGMIGCVCDWAIRLFDFPIFVQHKNFAGQQFYHAKSDVYSGTVLV